MTTTDAPWTVLKLLEWTRGHFERAEVDSPRLSAEVLLAAALDCRRLELYTRFEYLPNPDELQRYRDWVHQAAEGQPVAYLVGSKEFYSLTFTVTPDVLIPRPETEILVASAIEYLRALPPKPDKTPPLVWDVCTGSGCVAVAIAKNVPTARVLATDVCPQAVAVAEQNSADHGLADRVTVGQADLLTIPAEWTGPREFDVVTANPPYVADGDEVERTVKHEPAGALKAGADGLDVIRPLIAAAPAVLKPGGLFCMEFGYRHADAVRDLLLATAAFEEPKILKDHQDIERAVAAKKK